jgi:hypothetical protein
MLTRGEARSVTENTLQGRGRTRAMTPEEMRTFCHEMLVILDFTSTTDKLADIQAWAASWEARRFH